ncbi:MAG TPA: DMT family transporter [Pyrinomonadaceae bacterium]|jgi:drug/metabolite transporter (DMT)-like permease|nr:DMT family transporter [Pyrinomonadaceae bacterium]
MTSNQSFKDHSIAPHAALVLVQIMFGTWPIFGKVVLRSMSSTSLVCFRIFGAAIVFTLLQRKLGELRQLPWRVLAWLLVSSLLGISINQFVFVKGLSLTTAINSTLLITTIPVSTLVCSIALGYDKASLRHFLGIALAAAGVIYLVDPWRADFTGQTTLGNLLLIASSFSYGAYIAVSRNLFRRYGALSVITWMFQIAAVLAIPVAAFSWSTQGLHVASPGLALAIVYIILVPTVGAYYLNSWAITRVSPSVVAVYIYLQPLMAFGLAPLLLGESLNSRTIVACVLIFAGVAVVTIRSRSRAVEEISEHPDALTR